MIKDTYTCEGQMDIFSFLDKQTPIKEPEKRKLSKYPNCSQDEIDYILPILKIDACQNMREQIYKEYKTGMSDDNLCKCLKYYYKAWRREAGVEHEYILHFSADMKYQSVITYPGGMELRRKPGDTTGCCVNTWGHTLVLIKDMIAAGDYVAIPEIETHPTLIKGYTCEYDHNYWCNRYGNELPVDEYKADLVKGYACAGCCHNCNESPIFGGKCKWDCRMIKRENASRKE